MIEYIPFVILGTSFFLTYISKGTDATIKHFLFMLAFALLPPMFYVCAQVAVADTNTAVEGICNSLCVGFLAIFLISFADSMFNWLSGTLEAA